MLNLCGVIISNLSGFFCIGTTVTLVRWLMGLVFARFVLKFVTRTMRFLTPNMVHSSVTVERRKMAVAW